jgi:hypothetical protein
MLGRDIAIANERGKRPVSTAAWTSVACVLRRFGIAVIAASCSVVSSAADGAARPAAALSPSLRVGWTNRFLTISGPHLPGPVIVHHLEAYCRPGSTDRDWSETVIGHKTEVVEANANGTRIRLRDTLSDGVVVTQTITAGVDEVDFRLTAFNPAQEPSLVFWAQPCIRVDQFTGASTADARALHPAYIRQCFIFLDGKPVRLPTEPWADKARYTPGQVYCPAGVNRNDVNPRPLSSRVPSHGLAGCYSADGRSILAFAWEPYQEIFQGVITCLHSDFRIGGLRPGERKRIRGKIYLVPADMDRLVKRYEADFPEQVLRWRQRSSRAANDVGDGRRGLREGTGVILTE